MSTPKDQYDALGDEQKLESLQRFAATCPTADQVEHLQNLADSRLDAFRRFLGDEFPEQLPTLPGDVTYSALGVARLNREVAA